MQMYVRVDLSLRNELRSISITILTTGLDKGSRDIVAHMEYHSTRDPRHAKGNQKD